MIPVPDDELLGYDPASVQGKVVLLTGGASGLGRGISLKLAAHGAKLLIGDSDAAAAAKTASDIVAAGGDAFASSCNVAEWVDQVDLFEAAVKQYGAIDIVISNADMGPGTEDHAFEPPEFEDSTPKKPDFSLVDATLRGALYTTRLAIHYLALNKNPESRRALILVGAMAHWQVTPSTPLRTASEGGIFNMMRSFVLLLEAQGIRIAAIHVPISELDSHTSPDATQPANEDAAPALAERAAGAIIRAATSSDAATNGSTWLVTAEGPALRRERDPLWNVGPLGVMRRRGVFLARVSQGVKAVLSLRTVGYALGATAVAASVVLSASVTRVRILRP